MTLAIRDVLHLVILPFNHLPHYAPLEKLWNNDFTFQRVNEDIDLILGKLTQIEIDMKEQLDLNISLFIGQIYD